MPPKPPAGNKINRASQPNKHKSNRYYFYLLQCRDRSLYAGVAKDLTSRENAHNSGRGSAYVNSRGGGKIIYHEKFKSKSGALKREAAVKKLSRLQKLHLINKHKDKL